MGEISLVILGLGLLFATLQYPSQMKKFWKWTLIIGGTLILVGGAGAGIIGFSDTHPNVDWYSTAGMAFGFLTIAAILWAISKATGHYPLVVALMITIFVGTVYTTIVKPFGQHRAANVFGQFDPKPADIFAHLPDAKPASATGGVSVKAEYYPPCSSLKMPYNQACFDEQFNIKPAAKSAKYELTPDDTIWPCPKQPTKKCYYPDGTTFVPGAAHSDEYFREAKTNSLY